MSGRVVIAGGSGLLGSALADHLQTKGYDIVSLTRSERSHGTAGRAVQWDGEKPGEWVHELEGAQGVVNLCGAPISMSWTEANREKLVMSRVLPTRALADAIAACAHPPKALVSISGIGVYGDRGDEVLDERSDLGPRGDFLVDLCTAWEASAEPAESRCRVVLLRTAPVLSPKGGFLAPIRLVAKLFLGGRWGSGRQYLSWIHERDWVSLVEFCLESDLQGPVIAASPQPETNEFYMAAVRAVLRRPWAPPTPAFVFRLVEALGGPPARLALDSIRVNPQVAANTGFRFNHPSLTEALTDCLRS